MNAGLGGFPVKENVDKWGNTNFVGNISGSQSGVFNVIRVANTVGANQNSIPTFIINTSNGEIGFNGSFGRFAIVGHNSQNGFLPTASTTSANYPGFLGLGLAGTIGSNMLLMGVEVNGKNDRLTFMSNTTTNEKPTTNFAQSITLLPVRDTRADSSGANFIIEGGMSQGSGIGGSIVFATSQFTGVTGAVPNLPVPRMVINSSGDINHLSSVSFFPSGNSANVTLGNSAYYFNTSSSATTWTLPLLTASTGRMYFLKNRAGTVTLTGQSSDMLFSTAVIPSLGITSGQAYIAVAGQDYWDIN